MPDHKTLAAALCAAQAEMPNAVLDKINPHFKNRYASLASIHDASIPSLTKHGLSITQEFDFDEMRGGFIMRTVLHHNLTDEKRFSYHPLLLALDKPQAMGSNQTYTRRYSWSSLLAMAAEEDDDAEGATSVRQKSAHKARKDGDWPILIEEINQQQTSSDLRAWGVQNQHRIGALPENWKEHLREAFSLRLKELGGNSGPPSTIREDLKASLALTKEESEVIDPPDPDEVSAADLLTDNPQEFLDDLDGTMAGAVDEAGVLEVWEEYAGVKEILPQASQDQAQMIFERHRRRVQADSAVNKMREGKKK